MLTIRSSADLARALDDPLDPNLRQLLTLRRDQLLADGADADLGDLCHLIVARRDDTLAAVEAEVGFPLAGEDAPIEWVRRHPGAWLETAVVTDDDGFTVAVLVADCICTDTGLLRALLAHA